MSTSNVSSCSPTPLFFKWVRLKNFDKNVEMIKIDKAAHT